MRRFVLKRAHNLCEYCGLSQVGQAATFHIDHIIPVTANGPTDTGNLALACVACSLYKSAQQTALDPLSNKPATIFNPRLDIWQEHFQWQDVQLVGLTPTGRATIKALKMNRPAILAIRQEEHFFDRHPPKWHR
ncbi:MAG TPA: HNH endonuclease signature motif containing protein [Anaerolineae bacterium]|nr:HNH endonuclease signature motif containing protein [Anaerolineae bacterium]